MMIASKLIAVTAVVLAAIVGQSAVIANSLPMAYNSEASSEQQSMQSEVTN